MQNDFLGNVALRAMRNTELDSVSVGLKPRLASQFELPISSATLTVDQPSEAFDSPEAGVPLRESEPVQPEHPRRKSKEPWRMTMDRDEEMPVPRKQAWAESDRSGQIHMEQAAQSPLSYSPPKPIFEFVGQKKTEQDPSPIAMPALIQPITHPQRAVEDVLNPRGEMPIAPAPAKVPERQEIANPEPERIEIIRAETRLPKSDLQPRLVPLAAIPVNRSQPTEPQPPTINITIGRIEVKAATPSLSPKRNAPVSTTMGLDEYLRRRSEGNR